MLSEQDVRWARSIWTEHAPDGYHLDVRLIAEHHVEMDGLDVVLAADWSMRLTVIHAGRPITDRVCAHAGEPLRHTVLDLAATCRPV